MGKPVNKLKTAIELDQEQAHLTMEDIDPDLYNPPLIDEPLSTGERAIMNALDELGTVEGAQLRVYREIKGQPNEFLFQPDFTDDILGTVMATIQEFYGKGQYRLQARVPGGQLRMNQLISVGDAPKRKDDPKPVDTTGGVADMMRMQMQMAQQSKSDLLQMFAMMQQSQTSMIAALAGREQPQARDGLDIKDVLTLLPLLTGKNDDATGILLKGIELGKELGGGGGDDGMIGLAKTALGSIGEFARQIPPQNPQPVAQTPRQVNPLPAPVSPVKQDAVLNDIDALVRVLTNAAKRGASVDVYAETVIDMLGDDDAFSLCSDPANITQLATLYPALQPYPEWLELLRVAVVELFSDDTGTNENEVIHSEPATGDATGNDGDGSGA